MLRGYLCSKREWRLWALFLTVLAAYAVNIRLALLYNDWNGRFFNALQAVDRAGILRELFYFMGLAAAIILLLVWADYLKGRLKLALRRGLTELFFKRWLSQGSAHCLLKSGGREPDNPDQRITEDVALLASLSVGLAVGLYDSLLTLGSFSVVLWELSGPATLGPFTIPGYMFWVCIAYSAAAALLTHLIGRKLMPLNVEAQRREADLRAALIERRTHADAIAGAHGEGRERTLLTGKLSALLSTLVALLKRQRDLSLFTVGVGQFTYLAPIFFSLPAFLSGAIQLGGLMQIRGAFGDVARSLAWFVRSYESLAQLASAWERLSKLEAGLSQAEEGKRLLEAKRKPAGGDLLLSARLLLQIPGKEPEAAPSVALSLAPGTLTLITGPSGSGKSTLLKALAGLSPLYEGEIAERGSLFWIPQKPYLPKGPLLDAIAYPGPVPEDPDRIPRLLAELGLSHLVPRLGEDADWEARLSGGEAQRLMLTRAILASPRVLLADEMTGGLDERAARAALRLLRAELPETALVLVTHQRHLEPEADAVIPLSGD